MLEIKRVSDETIAQAVSWLHRQQASWRFLLEEERCARSSCADRRGHNEPLCSFMEKTVLTTVFESNLYVPRKPTCLDTVAAWFDLELHSWVVKQEKLKLFCKVLKVCRLALGPLDKGRRHIEKCQENPPDYRERVVQVPFPLLLRFLAGVVLVVSW